MSANVEKMSDQMVNNSKDFAVMAKVVTTMESEMSYRREQETEQQRRLANHDSRLLVIESTHKVLELHKEKQKR